MAEDFEQTDGEEEIIEEAADLSEDIAEETESEQESMSESEEALSEEAPAADIMPIGEAAMLSLDEELPSQSFPRVKKKRKSHLVRNIILAFVAVVIIAVIACGVALVVDDDNRIKLAPENTTLDGVIDLSGMTYAQVEEAVDQSVADGNVAGITIKVQEDSYEVPFTSIATADKGATADAVFALYDDSKLNRCIERLQEIVFKKKPAANNIDTHFTLDSTSVTHQVESISSNYKTDAVNAGYKYDSSTNTLVTVDAVPGVTFDTQATVTAINEKAAEGKLGFEIDAVAKVVEPDTEGYGRAIFVDTSACHLYFYDDGKVVKDYPCTPGMSGYATPTGDFYVEYKDAAPTWYNPHSSWSEGMAETIAPGASNPLGLRALAVSCGGGIYIHGTTNTGGLGSPGSHGCIRLANDSIVELFPLVEVNDPIFIR